MTRIKFITFTGIVPEIHVTYYEEEFAPPSYGLSVGFDTETNEFFCIKEEPEEPSEYHEHYEVKQEDIPENFREEFPNLFKAVLKEVEFYNRTEGFSGYTEKTVGFYKTAVEGLYNLIKYFYENNR